jgi:ubiquinone/menaquinone biosynthesis C-methylase UbiE
MAIEFTGERVVPGQVDTDLWNEHFARYAFAARLARGKRVLDMGCGTGYGAGELAKSAAKVTGIDVSGEAVGYAREHFSGAGNVEFLEASATSVPLADQCFDLIVAFEVIEHLADWRKLLEEARRLMATGGQFVVSTPNKSYYQATRVVSGPNPYHAHEFEYEEFREALAEFFPHTTLFFENHSDGIVFQAAGSTAATSANLRMEVSEPNPTKAHFFIAVCALAPMMGAPTFVYLPTAANVLLEREEHIQKLEGELRKKDEWLAKEKAAHQKLNELHTAVDAELKKRTAWGLDLDKQLQSAWQMQEADKKARKEMVEGYEAELRRVEGELQEKAQWGIATKELLEGQLAAANGDLAKAVELLHQNEALVEERTKWAQNLNAEVANLKEQLATAGQSKWIKLGRKFGVGPQLN